MRMFIVGRRMRVNQHHAIDKMHMGEHNNAHLIGNEQSHQQGGNEQEFPSQHPNSFKKRQQM